MVTAETAAALLCHLLLGHAVFHQLKVVFPPVGLALGEVDTAGGVFQAEGGGGDLQVGGNIRVEITGFRVFDF